MFEFLKRLFGIKPKQPDRNSEKEQLTQKRESVPVQTSNQPFVHQSGQELSGQDDALPDEIIIQDQPEVPLEQNSTSEAKAPAVQDTAIRETAPKTPTARRTKVPKRETKTESPNSVQQAAVPKTQRSTVAPRVRRNAVSAPERRTQKTSVYIGLDFGTTFTKAAFEIAPSNVHKKYSIKFGTGNTAKDYYLPSVLYFDKGNGKLKLMNDTGKLEEIRYFKYNMISDALQKNKVINDPSFHTNIPKEQLCCVFFLGNVIHLIRMAVNDQFGDTVLNEGTSWYINMGVPLEAHKEDERAQLYKKVLEIAYLFEQKYQGQTSIGIHELDDFFAEHMAESNPNMNILPEIYAEVLLYQQYLNAPAGFYTVVDIGGGTEDIATFLKMTDELGEKVECLAQNVISCGYDSVSEKIVERLNKTSVKKAKSFLRKDIDFNNDTALRENVPPEVNYEALIDARKQCRTLFGACVQRARKTREDILKQTVSACLPMHVFVMGGARDVAFYRSSIEHMKKAQETAGIPFFKDADVFDYVGKNTRLEIRNDQRLVISQMLAQPYEMIPEIDKMPWDLKEQDVTSKGLTWYELQERQNELYPV